MYYPGHSVIFVFCPFQCSRQSFSTILLTKTFYFCMVYFIGFVIIIFPIHPEVKRRERQSSTLKSGVSKQLLFKNCNCQAFEKGMHEVTEFSLPHMVALVSSHVLFVQGPSNLHMENSSIFNPPPFISTEKILFVSGNLLDSLRYRRKIEWTLCYPTAAECRVSIQLLKLVTGSVSKQWDV